MMQRHWLRAEGQKGHTRIAPGVCAGYGWAATCSCSGTGPAAWVRAEAARRGVTVTTILNEAIQAAKDKREQP